MRTLDILPWNESFNTGIALIDEQHRRLVDLLNRLASHIAYQSDHLPLNQVFDELVAYAAYHFDTEEAVWREHLGADESAVQHHEIHQQFVRQVLRLRREHETATRELMVDEVLVFLTRWLAAHILDSDRRLAYVVHARLAGKDLGAAKAQAEQQMADSQAILMRLILSVFQSLSQNTLVLMRELAQRKQREAELELARSDAEAASRAKSQFLATMSHEIRTPLNGILGMAQLLMHNVVSDDERSEFAETIQNSGNELLTRLTDMLELASLETGTTALAAEPVAPADLLNMVRDAHTALARVKGISLTCQCELDPARRYLGDPRRLRQMIDHLVDNAIKFAGSGSIGIRVASVMEGDRPFLEFSVTDQGPGVPFGMEECIFDAFRQADQADTRRHGGTGIGLAIVRKLARHMGGDAGCLPAPERGARFWFRCPASGSDSGALIGSRD